MQHHARPQMSTSSASFVEAHRLVGEVAAARPVLLRSGEETLLCSPLDGGAILSRTLAIAPSRAAYLGLADAATRLIGACDAQAMWALATGDAVDLATVEIVPGGPIADAATELAKLAERLPAMTLAPGEDAPDGTLSADVAAVLSLRIALAGTMTPVATAKVPLAAGAIATVTAYRNAVGGSVSAVIVGELGPGSLVRIHSSCVTGDIFGSLKCDCGAQLHLALERIASEGGVLVYTAQEGRGIGLVNKLRAYALQDRGLDTVDANVALGYHDDERDYAGAASVLRDLGLCDVALMTNNPKKADALRAEGIAVTAVPLIGPVTPHNEAYLATKRRRSGHLF